MSVWSPKSLQGKLASAASLVQWCVIYGPNIAGAGCRSLSACLVTRIKTVQTIVDELGAFHFCIVLTRCAFRLVCMLSALTIERRLPLVWMISLPDFFSRCDLYV